MGSAIKQIVRDPREPGQLEKEGGELCQSFIDSPLAIYTSNGWGHICSVSDLVYKRLMVLCNTDPKERQSDTMKGIKSGGGC